MNKKWHLYDTLWLLIFIVVLFLFMNNLRLQNDRPHTIIEVTRVNQAKEYFDSANQDTLILCDIDSTLTTPSDPYWQRQAIQRHNEIYQKYVADFDKHQLCIFLHLITLQSPAQLLEKEWTIVIQKLQQRGIKIFGFTASKMTAIGKKVNRFSSWRHQELARFGIDFSMSFPGTYVFENLEDFGGEHPGIEKGIIYTGQKIKKGDVLETVFNTLKWIPPKLIVIDDKIDNIKSCEDVLKKLFPQIYFVGIHYKGVEKLPRTITQSRIFEKNIKILAEQVKQITKE